MTERPGEKTQKTVAELLAEHGGAGGRSGRRHRRAKDAAGTPEKTTETPPADAMHDTAPQAIIDRVTADNMTQTRGRVAERPAAPPRGQQPSGSFGRPPANTQGGPPPASAPSHNSGPFQRPAPQNSGNFAAPVPSNPAASSPQNPVPAPGTPVVPPVPAPPMGRPPSPHPHDAPEPLTEQFAAVADDASAPVAANAPAQEAAEATQIADLGPVGADEPPAGLTAWRERRLREQMEDTEISGIAPVRPDDAATAAPAVDQVADDDLESTGYHDVLADEDDDLDEPGEADDKAEEDDAKSESADESSMSPGKQWLVLAAQLAAGVVAGAIVWLGFNWLWIALPPAALICALAVIVGLIWVMRKVRHADDIQTMVLTVLAGLIVTVSPAALLLLSK